MAPIANSSPEPDAMNSCHWMEPIVSMVAIPNVVAYTQSAPEPGGDESRVIVGPFISA